MIISGGYAASRIPNPGPITQIQPFTYEDGVTFAELLSDIKRYIVNTLEPYLVSLNIEIDDRIATLIASVDAALDAQTKLVDDKLEVQNDANDEAIKDLTEYVNEQVQLIINHSIQVQDPVVAGMLNNPDSQTSIALRNNPSLRNPMRHVKEFGVVGNGIADDTAAFNAAVAKAVEGRFALYSDYNTIITVDPITMTQGITLEGSFAFKARTDNQPFVLKISRGLATNFHDWRAKVVIDGDNKALDGLQGVQFGRTYVDNFEVRNCKRWGVYFIPLLGNNNYVQWNRFRASFCGEAVVMDAVQLAATGNVDSSSAGYGTFQLPTAVAARVRQTDSVYFVSMVGPDGRTQAYKVKAFTTDVTVEIYNLNVGNGNTAQIKIYSGGGVNIPRYGDNGVGKFGGMDIFSNPGIGVHISSLYGHVFDDIVAQVNGIGFAVWDYTKKIVMSKPYFELNDIDVAIWNYTEGVVLSPLSDFTKWQHLISRAGGSIYDISPAIHIIDQQIGGGAPYLPATNPGARTFRPGDRVAINRTAGDTIMNIDNSGIAFAHGWNVAKATIARTTKTRNTITVGLTDATKNETVMGGASYSVTVHGASRVEAFRIGLDWRVLVTPLDDTLTLTAGTVATEVPSRIGQLANVGAVGYMAVGTAAGDWKQITN